MPLSLSPCYELLIRMEIKNTQVSVKRWTVDFGSSRDVGVVRSSPILGSVRGVEPAWDSPPPSAPSLHLNAHACVHYLSF